MSRNATAVAVLSLAVLAGTASAAETWSVDGKHADVSFQVRHLMSKVRGSFNDVGGTIVVDRARPEASSVEFTIQAGSIDTGIANRDAHLRSGDFFDVEKHPTITFRSSKVVPRGTEDFEVTGLLTMRGVSREVTLPVKLLGFQKDARGNDKVGFETSTTLARKDFGIVWNQALDTGGFVLGDDVAVSISLQASRQAPTPAK